MDMEAETKVLLAALVNGQVRLDEGQARLQEALRGLALGQQRSDRRMEAFTANQEKLDRRVDKLVDTTDRILERLTWQTKQIVRGFTRGASRDFVLERRTSSFDRRLRKVERAIATLTKKKPRKS